MGSFLVTSLTVHSVEWTNITLFFTKSLKHRNEKDLGTAFSFLNTNLKGKKLVNGGPIWLSNYFPNYDVKSGCQNLKYK